MPFRTPKRHVLESETASASKQLAHRQLRKCRRTPSLSQWLTLSAATAHAAGAFQKHLPTKRKARPYAYAHLPKNFRRPHPVVCLTAVSTPERGVQRVARRTAAREQAGANPEGRQDPIPGRNLNEPANKGNSRHVSPPFTHSPAPSRQTVAATTIARPDTTQNTGPPRTRPTTPRRRKIAPGAPGTARAQKERMPTTCAASDWHSQSVRFKMGLNQRPPD